MNELNGDCIKIKNLKVDVNIGVADDEISSAQEVAISLNLVPAHSLDNLDDDIERTVDYHVVTLRVKETAASIPRRLIETLAEDIATVLLSEFHLLQVTVEIRKFILNETDYVAVKLVRNR